MDVLQINVLVPKLVVEKNIVIVFQEENYVTDANAKIVKTVFSIKITNLLLFKNKIMKMILIIKNSVIMKTL